MKYAMFNAICGILLLTAGTALADRTVSESRDARPDGRISLHALTGHYRITGSDEARLEIDGILGEDVEELVISGEPDDWTIEIRPLERRGWFRSAGRSSSNLEIRVPRGAELDVNTVSAGLDIADLTGSWVKVQSISGAVALENVRPERLEVETVSGSLSADAGGQETMLKTVSGNVEVAGLSGRLQLKSVSGNLNVRVSAAEDVQLETVSGSAHAWIDPLESSRLQFSSHSGDLRIVLPADVPMDLRASTFSGRISNAFGGDVQSGRGPGERMNFRTGAGTVRIKAQSFSGGVTVEKNGR